MQGLGVIYTKCFNPQMSQITQITIIPLNNRHAYNGYRFQGRLKSLIVDYAIFIATYVMSVRPVVLIH